eukprot:scaffold120805_cov33-Phaeocystis_antarctica.AAC.1
MPATLILARPLAPTRSPARQEVRRTCTALPALMAQSGASQTGVWPFYPHTHAHLQPRCSRHAFAEETARRWAGYAPTSPAAM